MANRKEIGKTPTLKTIPKQPNPARNPAQIQYQTGPALLPLTLSLGPAPQPNTARPALGPSAWPQASSGARVLFPAGPRPARALSLPRLFPLGPSLMRRPTASNLPRAARSRPLALSRHRRTGPTLSAPSSPPTQPPARSSPWFSPAFQRGRARLGWPPPYK